MCYVRLETDIHCGHRSPQRQRPSDARFFISFEAIRKGVRLGCYIYTFAISIKLTIAVPEIAMREAWL
jgi:hypothetical protein